LPVSFLTITWEIMTARTCPRISASSQRRSPRQVSLTMLSSPTLFSTPKAMTTSITRLSLSMFPLLEIPRELLTSTPRRFSWAE
jgi:hypothetical protein